MIKFIAAALLGTSLALTYNYFKHKESEQPTPVKETVQAQPKQDYRLSRVRVIKDTDRRISCFFDVVKQDFINCSLY